MKNILTTAAPLALLAMAAAPAQAADYGAARVATPSYGTWADLTAAAGIYRWVDDNDNSDTKSAVRGEGRVGMGLGGGAMLQVDVSGSSFSKGNSNNPVFDLAAHLGLMSGPGGGYGVMVSLGDAACSWECDRIVTIAGEAVWGIGALGPARLGAQLGWTTSLTDDDSVGYIHGVLDFMAGPNVLLSVNLGYSSDSNDWVAWRYGAKAEMAFNNVVSGFIEWQGAHITNDAYAQDQNRVLLGLTLAVNGSGLANRSPLHDFNPWSGINHLGPDGGKK
ncbi:MAG: hypothetical protein U1E56_09770 [Bauldia sp.]